MKYLESLLLSLFAVFAPIHAVIAVVVALVLADFVTGVMAAKKRKEKITSNGFKRTVGKLALYEAGLCLAFLVQQYLTGDLFPASKIVSALVGLTELKSILENLDTINGEPVFSSVVARITQKQEKGQRGSRGRK